MKKILSTFMLFIILAVAVLPTIGMHFCGNKLHSVEVFSKQNHNLCCSKSVNNIETSNEYRIIHKNCCETHKVQIVTDTYQLQERSSNIIPFYTLPQVDWITTNYISSSVEIDVVSILQEYFPPDGFDAKNENILGFICILRI